MKDLISVIIPAFNVEKYIHRCMESLIKQTYSHLEILLVDDGSTDETGNICDKYAQKDNRIKVIHKKNGGQSEARNYALDIANGKYITFLDSDDYISEDYIEYLYNLLKNNNADISVCGVQIVNFVNKEYKTAQTEVKIYTTEEAFENLLYSEGIEVGVCAKLFPKEYFDDIRFPVGEKYEDIAIIALLMNKTTKIAYGNQRCYFYYTRQGSTSKSGFYKGELDYIKNVNFMLEFIKQHYPDIEDAVLRYKIYSYFRILRILLFSKNKNNQIQTQMIKNIKKDDKTVYKNPKTPKRDKIAIITLRCGLPIFKLSWFIYSKLTGRVL